MALVIGTLMTVWVLQAEFMTIKEGGQSPSVLRADFVSSDNGYLDF